MTTANELEREFSNVGVPQGARASPGLGNLEMTDLLLNLARNKVFNIAFADDLVVVLETRSVNELQKMFKNKMLLIESWCRIAGLKLRTEKSQTLKLEKWELDQSR